MSEIKYDGYEVNSTISLIKETAIELSQKNLRKYPSLNHLFLSKEKVKIFEELLRTDYKIGSN